MITQNIPVLPTPPSSNDATNFRSRADEFLSALPNFGNTLNTFKTEANNTLDEMNLKASQTAQKATEAQDAAATATAKAALAQSVVIPTNATYSLTQLDTRNTIMSKAAFNALAAERRANRAGSGFDEWGKHNLNPITNPNVNDGIYTTPSLIYSFIMGYVSGGVGISKTDYPLLNVNGVIHTARYINNTFSQANFIALPPAPTVLPYDATLTTEQIAMGVIKHADSSNSGLVTGGTGLSGTSVSKDITTVIGKSYTVEWVDNGTRNTSTFTATSTTTTVSKTGTNITRIAVFPSDAISRSDLVFLETWHEDVSEKDFVYPLGNVQYLGGVTDGMSAIISGAFSGSSTYSLFGNWQASGALVGKGYVWSGMSDAQKRAFVSNPENNCYLDGDKVIQVRYRIRVVAGMGDNWDSVNDTEYFTKYSTANSSLVYLNNYSWVVPKGKRVSINNEFESAGLIAGYFVGSKHALNPFLSNSTVGHFTASNTTTTPYTAVAYEGKCYALPIALVHRRNQGGYNATYNPHGTRTMTMSPTSIADCFNSANYNASTGYIGTSTSRPDGLFYDQISVEDFKPSNKGADLRATSKKRTAQSLIEEFAPKVIAGTALYKTNDTTALTTYKDFMEVRDTSGNRYPMKNKIGNVVTINDTVANKKGFSIVTQNGKQYLQVADDAASDATVQMNLSVTKYDLGVFDA